MLNEKYDLVCVQYLVFISPQQLRIIPWTLDYFNKCTGAMVPQEYLRGTPTNDDCPAACVIITMVLIILGALILTFDIPDR
jgi:hypothetical protein